MSETNNTGFSVLDMAEDYASANQIDVSEIFKNDSDNMDDTTDITSEAVDEVGAEENVEAITETKTTKTTKTPWMPDPSLTEGMEEFGGPVTYAKDEIRTESLDKSLKNISDDNAIKDSIETKNELDRKQSNIEAAKQRHGIKNFQIPPGPYHATIFAAAGDTNYDRAQNKLDEIFNEIKEIHPEFILEWVDKNKNVNIQQPDENSAHKNIAMIDDIPESATTEPIVTDDLTNINENINDNINDNEVKVVIDKTQLPEVSWSEEDIEKIRKSRTVELNIVETTPIEYSEIQDIDSNMVDLVLAPYQRKYNDTAVVLPASRYRATFTGLSYAELTDLMTSHELNSIDAERKKWSICFNHIHNQSIGPWEEYKWYIDPLSKKKVTIPINHNAPNDIPPSEIHKVYKFDDFLMKTSHMDLDFMIWKILCATAMETEIISITCHAKHNGKDCNNTYDWVYNPSELLRMDLINPAVLEEMRITGEVATKEEILNNYNNSPVRLNSTVKLKSSGIYVIFGHISGYEYLNDIFSLGEELNSMIEAEDPSSFSKGFNITMLRSIKAFLIPQENGKFGRITGGENILKVIESLDEFDWQTMLEITKTMIDPYNFKYSFQNLVCPKCHNRSSIDVENMTRLLFIVAQSLSSVQVVLKKT